MAIHLDSYFAVGKTHTVCQDYAATHNRDGRVFLALSDGCSSSPDTDFGSRILVKKAIALTIESDNYLSPTIFAGGIDNARRTLGLSKNCLDATLMFAQQVDDEVVVNVWGDGVLHVKYRSGKTETFDIEFPDNTPAYFSYLANLTVDNYLANHGKRIVNSWTNGTKDGVLECPVDKQHYNLESRFVLDEIESLFLFSDGVKSFCRMVNGAWQPIPLQEVLEQITAVKNCNGEFMVRRMRKFLYDFCPKNGWIHEDDIAVAAMINEVK
jgi:hypothetical protein